MASVMVSALHLGLSGPGSSPGRGHCVVLLKYSLSLHAKETGISSGLMGDLARMQTLPLPSSEITHWKRRTNPAT